MGSAEPASNSSEDNLCGVGCFQMLVGARWVLRWMCALVLRIALNGSKCGDAWPPVSFDDALGIGSGVFKYYKYAGCFRVAVDVSVWQWMLP